MDQQPALIRRVSPDASALATAVADALCARLAAAQAAGRVPAVGLTGGTIAQAIHRELGRIGKASGVDWSLVDFWWGDERYVERDSADRNDRDVIAILLTLGADPDRIHPMPASDDRVQDGPHGLTRTAASYGDLVRQRGGGEFEVLMLGVGPDGHVASLFPGSAQLEVDDQIATAVADSPKPPSERITLTFGALNRSRAVWFVASGASKAAAVAAAHRPGAVSEIPARGVHGRLETVWWLDAAAAAD